jgi:hypothetical protein
MIELNQGVTMVILSSKLYWNLIIVKGTDKKEQLSWTDRCTYELTRLLFYISCAGNRNTVKSV